MAAAVSAHGAPGMPGGNNVVSFISPAANKKQTKNLKRWKPFVKVSYDSGSDADVESDDEQVKKVKAPSKKTTKISKKRQKLEEVDPPEAPANESGSDADAGDGDCEPDEGEEEPRVPGAGWADVMAKILQRDTPAEAGSAVLAKSKDYEKAKRKEQEEYAERRKVKETKDQWEHLGRSKPQVTDKDVERKLQRIATRGVVQLFNAVKKQQKRFGDKMETAHSERKRAELQASVKKGDFLDLLKATPVITKKSAKKQQDKAPPGSKKPSWSVLQEDFMMGATMKDWDKQNDSSSDALDGDDANSDRNTFSDSD